MWLCLPAAHKVHKIDIVDQFLPHCATCLNMFVQAVMAQLPAEQQAKLAREAEGLSAEQEK